MTERIDCPRRPKLCEFPKCDCQQADYQCKDDKKHGQGCWSYPHCNCKSMKPKRP